MTHSPLPWKHEDRWITDAYGQDVAQGYTQSPFDNVDDAILAVTAVNAHAALVAALEEMVLRCDMNPTADYHIRARAALELARKGGA